MGVAWSRCRQGCASRSCLGFAARTSLDPQVERVVQKVVGPERTDPRPLWRPLEATLFTWARN
jgi:hypothetical protein